jgi:D-hexose-6-phosphate mutarotase
MTKPSIETLTFHGIDALRLTGPGGASVVVSRLGAQVLSWITPDGRERLFLSDKAVFDGSVAIRGGIPVCFPQFSERGDLPKHGFVRTREWTVAAQRCGDDYALLPLETADDEATRALWPHAFRLELTVMLEADRIDLELCVANPGEAGFAFTGALHTYLRTIQVEDVALEGAAGDVVFVEQGVADVAEGLAFADQLPDAGADGVEAEVGATAELEDDGFVADLAGHDLGRDAEAVGAVHACSISLAACSTIAWRTAARSS